MARPGRPFESRIRVKEDGRAFSERQNSRVSSVAEIRFDRRTPSHDVVSRDLHSFLSRQTPRHSKSFSFSPSRPHVILRISASLPAQESAASTSGSSHGAITRVRIDRRQTRHVHTAGILIHLRYVIRGAIRLFLALLRLLAAVSYRPALTQSSAGCRTSD